MEQAGVAEECLKTVSAPKAIVGVNVAIAKAKVLKVLVTANGTEAATCTQLLPMHIFVAAANDSTRSGKVTKKKVPFDAKA